MSLVHQLGLTLPMATFDIYIERLIHHLPLPEVGGSNESGDPRNQIMERSLVVSDLAQKSFLEQGRSEASIATAAVIIAFEAYQGKKTKPSQIIDLSDVLTCSKSQVQARFREMKQLLLEYAHQLPFFEDMDRKNMPSMLGSLIDCGRDQGWEWTPLENNQEEEEQSLNPPAFRQNAKKTRITRNRIMQVQKRLLSQQLDPLNAQETMEMDDKDEIIADYLIAGHSTQEILDFNPIFRKRKQKK